jgi:hypothetical protein
MLTEEQYDQWIAYLRDPKLVQGTKQLKRHLPTYRQDEQVTRYCCLGVVSEKVLGVDLDGEVTETNAVLEGCDEETYALKGDAATRYCELWPTLGRLTGVSDLPVELKDAVPKAWRERLSNMNDFGSTFSQIADYLERHKHIFFEGQTPPLFEDNVLYDGA